MYPTVSTRKSMLTAGLDEEGAKSLMKEVDKVKESVSDLSCSTAGTCDTASLFVKSRLENLGYNCKGVTLSWWRKGGKEGYYSNGHTAATTFIEGKEYVVDVTHLQFPHSDLDEQVIVLPIEAWAEEIAERNKGINPFLVFRMKTSSSLALFEPPRFTKPRLPKQKK